jgi:hypothetical protein
VKITTALENPEEEDDDDSVGRMGTLFFDRESSDEEEFTNPDEQKDSQTDFE